MKLYIFILCGNNSRDDLILPAHKGFLHVKCIFYHHSKEYIFICSRMLTNGSCVCVGMCVCVCVCVCVCLNYRRNFVTLNVRYQGRKYNLLITTLLIFLTIMLQGNIIKQPNERACDFILSLLWILLTFPISKFCSGK
uniref:Uncharacterized protein n=1 Tax=Rousettus aegyptiacus TaxID=9407 RepID=A0A7J8EK47_ROUAE|nr:hypothetical protein HJG63_012517 [Rousettus aegyptiacus]